MFFSSAGEASPSRGRLPGRPMVRLPTPRLRRANGTPPREEMVARQIADFLDGRRSGQPLLRAIYDTILEEPVPPRLTELVRRQEARSRRANGSGR